MRIVFIDTVALIALINKSDSLHTQVSHEYHRLLTGGARFVTSDWVFCELLGGAAKMPLRSAATNVVNRLCASQLTDVIPATHENWLAAFELYQARQDKGWSLVDCSSMLICRSRGIVDVLTADHHFAQSGLNVLIKA